MTYSLPVDTIALEFSIVHIEGSQGKKSKKKCISVSKVFFAGANHVQTDKMWHDAAFHLGFYCLQKNAFRSHQYIKHINIVLNLVL